MEFLIALFTPHGNSTQWLVVGFIFLLAGMVKGVIGLGLPTVAIALLSLSMTTMQAAALLFLPSLLTNIWQLVSGASLRPLLLRLTPMLLGICLGTFVSGLLFSKLTPAWSGAGLGVALLLYGVMGLASVHWHVSIQAERSLAPVIGFATGMVTATTGVFVLPSVPYLQALDLDKDKLVQAMGLSFAVSTLALGINLYGNGTLQWNIAGDSMLALLPALAGMQLGQVIRDKMQQALFRRCFFMGLLALGVHYLWGAMKS
ncbi:MAG: sulfite exporter TauE/SafE family protein [Burkholderiales bacterium]|nr:sulfite exporter TauE/SafE family protein [Burkholderiales bacterium]MBI3728211.1 sulfite exporter TauE/SafE family protein [Burkholderiales bacterium]